MAPVLAYEAFLICEVACHWPRSLTVTRRVKMVFAPVLLARFGCVGCLDGGRAFRRCSGVLSVSATCSPIRAGARFPHPRPRHTPSTPSRGAESRCLYRCQRDRPWAWRTVSVGVAPPSSAPLRFIAPASPTVLPSWRWLSPARVTCRGTVVPAVIFVTTVRGRHADNVPVATGTVTINQRDTYVQPVCPAPAG